MSSPLVLRSSGLFGQLANGETINAGGTSNSTWVIGNKGAILEDGTNSTGSGPGLSLQLAYDSTPVADSAATIVLEASKNLVIAGPDEDPLLIVNGDEGKVTINGDLEVLGANITISTLIIDSDHWVISPASGSTIAFHLNPDFMSGQAVTDLIRVRNYHNGPPVFTINKDGELISTQDISTAADLHVTGSIFVDFPPKVNPDYSRIHVGRVIVGRFPTGDPDLYYLGAASEVLFFGGQRTGSDVSIRLRYSQGTPEQGEVAVHKRGAWAFDGTDYGEPGQVLMSHGDSEPPTWESPATGIGTGNVHGFWYVQNTASATWVIDHAGTMVTQRRSITVYDASYEQVIPQSVQSISGSVVSITFAEPMNGFALVLLYAESTTP